MENKLQEITQILATEIAHEISLLSGLGGQILVCSELFGSGISCFVGYQLRKRTHI